jgi:hypothetical protein
MELWLSSLRGATLQKTNKYLIRITNNTAQRFLLENVTCTYTIVLQSHSIKRVYAETRYVDRYAHDNSSYCPYTLLPLNRLTVLLSDQCVTLPVVSVTQCFPWAAILYVLTTEDRGYSSTFPWSPVSNWPAHCWLPVMCGLMMISHKSSTQGQNELSAYIYLYKRLVVKPFCFKWRSSCWLQGERG